MPSLTNTQIDMALKRVPRRVAPKNNPPAFHYDAAIDDVVAGMYGRHWDRDETFPPNATQIYLLLSLFRDNDYDEAEVPMLLAILKTTRNDDIRTRAASALKSCLRDCSGQRSYDKAEITLALQEPTQ